MIFVDCDLRSKAMLAVTPLADFITSPFLMLASDYNIVEKHIIAPHVASRLMYLLFVVVISAVVCGIRLNSTTARVKESAVA